MEASTYVESQGAEGDIKDSLQLAYRLNRSADDAVNLLYKLDSTGTYARELFVDISSAFNNIVQ